jgi:hypothetical protein
MAGAQLVSDIAGVAQQTIREVGAIKKKAQQADDEIHFQTGETILTAEMKRLRDDPNMNRAVQEDGTPTPEYYQRRTDEILSNYREHMEKITDPDMKRAVAGKMRNREILERANIAGDLGVIQTRIATNNFFDGLQIAMDAGETDAGVALIQTAVERQLITPIKAAELNKLVDQKRVEISAQKYVDQVDAAYGESLDAGDAALAALIRDKDIEDDVKNRAIDQSEEKKTEWTKAWEQAVTKEQVQSLRNYTQDMRRAKAGEMSEEEINAQYEGEHYGDPESLRATQYWNQLLMALDAGVKRQQGAVDVEAILVAGGKIPRDSKHYDGLAVYESKATEGMSVEERIETISDISRQAGAVSTTTNHALNTNASDIKSAMHGIDLYMALTEDKDNLPDMRLDRDARILYEYASNLIRNNVPKAQAIETAWGIQHLTDDQIAENRIAWKESGEKQFASSYKGFVEKQYGLDFFEEFAYEVDAPPLQMQVEYQSVYESVYKKTRNPETAESIANDSISKMWVKTNFNSADPDDFTVEKFGLPGDSRYVRKAVIRAFEAEPNIQIKTPTGYKKAKINPETITFETFDNPVEAYDEKGNQLFKVIQDGVPLSRITENGTETLVVGISREKLEEHAKVSREVENTEKRIAEIKNEQKHLAVLTQESPYRDVGINVANLAPEAFVVGKQPTLKEKRLGAMEQLSRERERLEKHLPTLKVDFK